MQSSLVRENAENSFALGGAKKGKLCQDQLMPVDCQLPGMSSPGRNSRHFVGAEGIEVGKQAINLLL
jgi:hypothetical protein